ncbi:MULTISPECIES: PRC-barrel domain-containing protein [Halomonadaceae]|uniref:PRC-barrel domain-containing protein n=1 Tax=Modicisalibacter zincidurans TaxID=1178777 RepID=A0ABP9R5D8_9GAMM|nr:MULTISPECIES: PRC-barrel domain-containing protein [Halomonas]MCD6007298.1 PRC-barrel domain-containing protein [Halomonas sp. IOP_31]
MDMHKPFNKALLATLAAGTLSVGGLAWGAPQGLYSADELTDADVYSKDNPSEDIGDVEDVLLDENMKVSGLVIDTGNLLDMGSKQYVIQTGKFTVETQNGDDLENIAYQVRVDLTEQEITQQPEYTNDWWAQTKQNTSQAWQNTKETAQSAWESTKAATSNALTEAGNALSEAGNETEQAAQEASNETQEGFDQNN